MISSLIDVTFLVLQFLMFKICGIIGISKMKFQFSGTERVNQQLTLTKEGL